MVTRMNASAGFPAKPSAVQSLKIKHTSTSSAQALTRGAWRLLCRAEGALLLRQAVEERRVLPAGLSEARQGCCVRASGL